MKGKNEIVFLRYWGSHFKFRRQIGIFAAEMRPLVARGWRCHLVLNRDPEDRTWLRELTDLGVNIVHAERAKSHFDWRCVARVRSLVRRLSPTVFQCDNMHTSPLIGAFLGGAPVRIWAKRSMNPDYEQCRPRTWREQLAISTRLSCALATKVIAVSGAVRDELLDLGIAPGKVMVRNNPRRLGAPSKEIDRAEIRKNWGFSSENTVAIAVGYATPVKGWDVLLKAFAQALPSAPRLRLVLVGSQDAAAGTGFKEKLLGLIKEGGLEGKVVFTGHLTEVKAALQASDIFVMSSRSEGCSSSPIEALEAGLPCVVTRVGNAAELIEQDVNGLLVPRNDADALAAALQQISEPSTRARLARNAVVPHSVLTLDEFGEQLARDFEAMAQETGRFPGRISGAANVFPA